MDYRYRTIKERIQGMKCTFKIYKSIFGWSPRLLWESVLSVRLLFKYKVRTNIYDLAEERAIALNKISDHFNDRKTLKEHEFGEYLCQAGEEYDKRKSERTE